MPGLFSSLIMCHAERHLHCTKRSVVQVSEASLSGEVETLRLRSHRPDVLREGDKTEQP